MTNAVVIPQCQFRPEGEIFSVLEESLVLLAERFLALLRNDNFLDDPNLQQVVSCFPRRGAG